MRQISQVVNAKPKNSKFFDYFIKKHGETCTRTAGADEIYKNVRLLYLDLAAGSCQSDKYLGYLYSDPRIMQILYRDAYKRLMKWYIIYNSLDSSTIQQSNLQQLPEFQETLEESRKKYNTYSIMYNCLTNFIHTNQPIYLTQISVNLANKMNRDSNGQVCL